MDASRYAAAMNACFPRAISGHSMMGDWSHDVLQALEMELELQLLWGLCVAETSQALHCCHIP